MVPHEVSRQRRRHQHRHGDPRVLRMALDACGSIGRQYRALQTQRLFQRLGGICTALLIAAPLHALSCLPYGLPEALAEIDGSEDGYVAVTGKLSFNKNKLPKPDFENQGHTPELIKIKARLSGKALSRSGFTTPFNTPLTLQVHCLGEWCAGAGQTSNVLVFLKQTNQGYTLDLSPCGDHLFSEPTKKDLKTVQRCYLSEQCSEPNQN